MVVGAGLPPVTLLTGGGEVVEFVAVEGEILLHAGDVGVLRAVLVRRLVIRDLARYSR